MSKVRQPRINLTYTGTDITEAIAPYLLSVSYTDKLDNDSPDVDIQLEDSFQLWQNDWFPAAKDQISLTLYYEGEPEQLEAGDFEIDDPQFDFGSGGDSLRLGAQATPVSKDLREKRSKEYEDITLKAIAEEIATRQGLALTGEIADVTFERLTQDEESDLEFLARISKDYGQLFKVEGTLLIFYNWDDLDSAEAQFSLDRTTITKFSARKKLSGTYKAAKLTYSKGDDEEEVAVTVDADPPNDSEDVLKISTRAEDGKQAELKAKEKLRAANATEYEGTITIEGEPYYLAGVNFDLSGFGKFDGKWQIQQARHQINNSGWICRLKVRRISGAEEE